MRLGEILIKYGLISQEHLDTALEAQKKFNCRLGKALVMVGYVTEDDINWALSNQLKISYVHLNYNMIDISVAKSVPREVLELYEMIPIAKIHDELTLVMADPTDNKAIEHVKSLTKLNISISLGSSSNILSMIRQVFKDDEGKDLKHSDIENIKSDEHKKEISKLVSKELDSSVFIYTIVLQALEVKASEIHLEPTRELLRVRFKIDGVFYEHTSRPMSVYPQIMTYLHSLMNSVRESNLTGSRTFSIEIMGQDIRVNAFLSPTIYGQAAVFKLIPIVKDPVKFSDIEIEEKVRTQIGRIMRKNSGIIILSSPGKIGLTRTFYAMLREVPFNEKKVVTLEDFVMFRREEFVQLEYSSLPGLDDYEALNFALGQNPDVLMLSTDLNAKSVRKVFEIALTGKLVLLALPFQNIYTAFCYLNSIGIEPYALAGALQLIFVQRIFRSLCHKCKEKISISEYPQLVNQNEINYCYEKGKGCSECDFLGYLGKCLLYEYYIPSSEDRMKILQFGLKGSEIFLPSGYKTIKESCQDKIFEGLLAGSEI